MGEGGVLQFGVDLFDDRVVAVEGVGFDRVEVGVGDEPVVSPGVE